MPAAPAPPAPPHGPQALAAQYTGRAAVTRLLFVADHGGPALELEALRCAADVLKTGVDTALYAQASAAGGLARAAAHAPPQVMERIGGRLGAAYTLDKEWVEETDKRAAQACGQAAGLVLSLTSPPSDAGAAGGGTGRGEAEHGEGALAHAARGARASGGREFLRADKRAGRQEAIRLAHNELAEFQQSRGELQAAFKTLSRSRDYCTTGGQVVGQCLACVAVASAFPQAGGAHVANFASKAEAALEAASDPGLLAAVKVAQGLAQLDAKKYKLAAQRFTEAPADCGHAFSRFASPADVAACGALCALASMDRGELRAAVTDNVPFRSYLEAAADIRQLLDDFAACRYAAALALLARLRDGAMALDPLLRPHREALCEAVRRRAVCAYVAPFSRLRLDAMAAGLGCGRAEAEAEAAALIGEGHIQARIDAGAGLLLARTADARKLAFERALAAGEAYLRDTKALLLRASLLEHDCTQAGGRGARGGGEGEARRGARGWGSGGPFGGHHERERFGGGFGERHERAGMH